MVSSQVGGHLAVVGGGGFPYPGGEDTAEVLTEAQEWRAFRYPGVDRAFGVGIQVKKLSEVSQFVDSSTGNTGPSLSDGELRDGAKLWEP